LDVASGLCANEEALASLQQFSLAPEFLGLLVCGHAILFGLSMNARSIEKDPRRKRSESEKDADRRRRPASADVLPHIE
jgi:hypothetical protein